jgi:oligoendopeptidase F
MEPAREALAADLEVTGLSAWGRLYDRVSGRLEFDLDVAGEPAQRLPVSMARSLLGDGRAEVRRAALGGSSRAWASVGDVCAACLNAIAGTRLELDRRRGERDFLEPALFDAAVSRATLDAMLQAVGERREVARSYLRAKAAALGRARLGFQDLEAPLPGEGDARVPWSEARATVQRAFDAFHAPLGALAARAFERRWIDHAPRPGKRPGGFCSSSPLVGESRIFMTFGGSPGDVSTLAHELGHAFHAVTLQGVRPWARRYPMTLAETASTFAEQVLAEALLEDPATDAARCAGILDRRLRDAAAFLLNLPMRFTFERRLYEERADGELPVSRLCALMEEEQRAWYGEALATDELDPWFWASKLHFYLTGIRFYNFPYTFGYLLSLGMFARARREGATFLPRFEELLRRAGTGPAQALVRDVLGDDLETPDFWHASIDLVEEDLARSRGAPSGTPS